MEQQALSIAAQERALEVRERADRGALQSATLAHQEAEAQRLRADADVAARELAQARAQEEQAEQEAARAHRALAERREREEREAAGRDAVRAAALASR
jgi:hypothetical protein